MTTTTTNARPAHCLACGQHIAPHTSHAAAIASDGGRNRHICPACAAGLNDLPEGATIERVTVGTATRDGLTWGYRLFVEKPTTEQRAELAKAGYIPRKTSDPESVEFISPWKRSRCGSKQWRTLEALHTRGLIIIECQTAAPEALSQWVNAHTHAETWVKAGAVLMPIMLEDGAEVIKRAGAFIAKAAELFEKLQARPEWSVRYVCKLKAAELEAFPWDEGGEDWALALGMDA